MPRTRPTAQCARSWTETDRIPADATRASPATVGFDTVIETATAPAPATTPPARTEFPNHTGNLGLTRCSNAFRSMRPACSAQCAERTGSRFTCRRVAQNPSRPRSVSPPSTAASIRVNASWNSSGVELVWFVPELPSPDPYNGTALLPAPQKAS